MIMKERKTYDKTFKLEVVQRSLDGIPVKQLGLELGIHPGNISRWRKEFLGKGEKLSFPGKGVEALTEEQKKIRQLEKELADSKLETLILKKAIRIFSKSDAKSTNL
jgi:transposase